MQQIEIPALISAAPSYPLPLSDRSIIIAEHGVEFLIGEDASWINPNASRQIGGTLRDNHYRVLLKGLCAAILGPGSHKVKPAFAVALPYYDAFTGGVKNGLDKNGSDLLKDALSEITFKSKATGDEWQTCKIDIEDDSVVMAEPEAVFLTMHSEVQNLLQWQIGFGDWQQTLILNRRVQPQSTKNALGAIAPIQEFADKIGTNFGNALKAWETGKIQMPGIGNETVDVTEHKIAAMRKWVSAEAGRLLGYTRAYRENFKACVVSGGILRDDLFWGVLLDELKNSGLLLIKINELPDEYVQAKIPDPGFSVVQGLLKCGNLAIDVGNGYLKGGYVN